ncbi:DUF4303 domain-containing protein [Pseudomonas promysalinigenes]|jgi:hypothetical protein|uniref:DUF4303 domain-containing protein n=1 Tax=Pseudomonas promysalinigenes TaxID=485898 RepID=A0ABY6AS98_9PSED|nr:MULTISPECIES: DUF4303 domain-containing protein [Pseudomonas]UXH42178.1 DUF4303 domain-containing protein [Pseudomonas promysalinigenes]
MDWKEFEVEILNSVKRAIQDLLEEQPSEHFYAFALYTDSSAMTVALAANSIEALELKLQEEDEEERDECRPYYQWATSEWKYEGWRSDFFRKASAELRESVFRNDIEAFRKNLYSAMTSVLGELRRSDFFHGFVLKNPTLFVSVTDDDTAELVENHSARLLNASNDYVDFIKRYEG